MRLVVLVAVISVAGGCGFTGNSADASSDGGADANPCSAIGLAAGGSHTCARDGDGGVWCWGLNDRGQIGTTTGATCTGLACATRATRVQPLPVAGGLGVGDGHGCAATIQGTYCWGDNTDYQFGNGTMTSSMAPVHVDLRDGATSIAGGENHTCSIHGGMVRCSGVNSYGEVGNSTFNPQPMAMAAGALVGASAVATGFNHTCASLGGAGVWCWGRNGEGQVSPSAPGGNLPGPTLVGGVSNAAVLAAGLAHSCAIESGGTGKCWGANNVGQLGIGNMTTQTMPVEIATPSSLLWISAAQNHACAVQTDGAVYCWGVDYNPTPTMVALPRAAAQVVSGAEHDCARLDDGTIYCWGRNTYGQLGNGSSSSAREDPVLVSLCSE